MLFRSMRQRIMIAMAMACQPRLLIADEPTTALDVTIQAQILDLIYRMREQFNISVLLITHDLGVVAEAADRVAVMYCGRIVEEGSTEEILTAPQHPYTLGLLKSIPRLDENSERLFMIPGMVPPPEEVPPGCAFADRCDQARPECRTTLPDLIALGSRKVRCLNYVGYAGISASAASENDAAIERAQALASVTGLTAAELAQETAFASSSTATSMAPAPTQTSKVL